MTVTAALVALEALAVLGAAVVSAVNLGAPGPLNAAGRVFLLILMVAAAAFAFAASAKHLAGRAWSRGAIVVWQLFQIILSIQYLTGGAVLLGLGLLVPGAVALVLTFSPMTRAFLAPDDRPRG